MNQLGNIKSLATHRKKKINITFERLCFVKRTKAKSTEKIVFSLSSLKAGKRAPKNVVLMMKIRYNLQYVLMAIIPPQGIHFFRGTGLCIGLNRNKKKVNTKVWS